MKNNNQHNPEDNEKLNELFDAIAAISFDPAEKEALALRLSEFADTNPVLSSAPSPVPLSVASPFSVPVSFRNRLVLFGKASVFDRKKLMPIALVLVFVLVGSTSVAAESALPGDILYPVKIHVNEQVSTMLSVGAKSTAKTQISHADNRLVEAEKLSSQNKLSSTTQAAVKAGFVADAEKIAEHVKTMVAEGKDEAAAEVSSDFEASLESHRDLLVALSEKGDNQQGLLADLAGVVNARLGTSFDQSRSENENTNATGPAGTEESTDTASGTVSVTVSLMATRSENKPVKQTGAKAKNIATTTTVSASALATAKAKAEGARISAKTKIDIAHEYINDKGDELDLSLVSAAKGQVSEAERLFNQGEMQFSAGEYAQAYTFFNQSSRYAQRAKLVLDSGAEIKSVISSFLKISNDGSTTTGTTTSKEFHSSKNSRGNSVKVDSKITATTSSSKEENKSENGGSVQVENKLESSVENTLQVRTSTGGITTQGQDGQDGVGGQSGSTVNTSL